MLFDDRLVTVLRARPGGETAARTQYRQLIDLIGSTPAKPGSGPDYSDIRDMVAQLMATPAADRDSLLRDPALSTRDPVLLTHLAFLKLAELSELIPEEERSRILREPGLRLRNRHLVSFLAERDAKPAAAAVATAQLSEEDWIALIPELPIVARGFLRHRRDLPAKAKDVLRQLGVRDLVLPQPEGIAISHEIESSEPEVVETEGEKSDGIRALLRRIEAFREGKRSEARAPRLPLGDAIDEAIIAPPESFSFSSGVKGQIDWADTPMAPQIVGLRLGGRVAQLDEHAYADLQMHQPLRKVRLVIDATEAISGEWLLEADPRFDEYGHFLGYLGRIRRAVSASPAAASGPADTTAERMRQVLHELRTPVNAIQGFAEIIQQQLFGPAPNEYRAMAAGIAVDAAKLLASFDEIDRLTKLESRAMEMEQGEADLREAVMRTVQRLEGALRSRNAGFAIHVSGSPFVLGISHDELMAMTWRILATFAGALDLKETIDVTLASDGTQATLEVVMPQSIARLEDKFNAPVPEERPAISAGMFGTGFAFRLARAEVQAAGGGFEFSEEVLRVTFPLLTTSPANHSTGDEDGQAA